MLALLPLYKALLETAWMAVDDKGFVNVRNKTTPTPVSVAGRQLVLPTDAQLRNPDVENRIMFHPLLESALKGESAIVAHLRHCLAVRLNFTIGSLLRELLDLAASTQKHQNLSPIQSEILSPLKQADEKTVVDFARILVNATKKLGVESAFVSLYLKRGGEVEGKLYARAGIVTFPVYEELLKDQTTYFEVDLRKKDIATYRALFRHVFPGIDNHFYNKGSDSDMAPYLDSLMKTVAGVIGVTNDLVNMYGKILPDHEQLFIETEWAEGFENLNLYLSEVRMIPAQFTTDGASRKADEMAAAGQVVQGNAVLGAGVGATPPAGHHGRSFSDVMAQRDQNMTQYQQQQQPQQPGYVPSPTPTAPLNTNKGLSFKELQRRQQQNAMNNQGGYNNGYGNNQQQQGYRPNNNSGWGNSGGGYRDPYAGGV